MPVTLKIEDKQRQRVQAPGAPPPAELGDYAVANERAEGVKAFFIWFFMMLLICGIPFGIPNFQSFGIGLTAWWLVSVIIYYVVVPRIVLRRLRFHGAEFEITAKKQPRLKTMLSKGSALLGLSEPEGFLSEELAPQVRLLGNKDPYFLHRHTRRPRTCFRLPNSIA